MVFQAILTNPSKGFGASRPLQQTPPRVFCLPGNFNQPLARVWGPPGRFNQFPPRVFCLPGHFNQPLQGFWVFSFPEGRLTTLHVLSAPTRGGAHKLSKSIKIDASRGEPRARKLGCRNVVIGGAGPRGGAFHAAFTPPRVFGFPGNFKQPLQGVWFFQAALTNPPESFCVFWFSLPQKAV